MFSTTAQLPQYRSAESLEKFLGDPRSPASRISFEQAIADDEQERYPAEAAQTIESWSFHNYYIPAEYGGRLTSYEELLSLIRVISRRDLTLAIGHGKTYLGSVGIWVSQDTDKKWTCARLIKAGHQIALGLTERDHGSDLISNEVTAEETADGFVLSGEKWLINNATRSRALSVFARTSEQPGPRGFSLFLVDKEDLDVSSYRHLDKVKTHGIRGADISGIRFDRAMVPKSALVSAPGVGLEDTLKGFQVTRTVCAALSLGAMDTALRATVDFALKRQLYERQVAAIPYPRRQLVDAFTSVLISDCLAIATTRAIHTCPDQMSIWAAVIKYFVPTLAADTLHTLSGLLGARSYLREAHWSGIFQKMNRDNGIVGIFDGSSTVNLYSLSLYLRHWSKGYWRSQASTSASTPSVNASHDIPEAITLRAKHTFDLSKPLPPADLQRLQLYSREGNDAILTLSHALHQLKTLSPIPTPNALTSQVVESLIGYVTTLLSFLLDYSADFCGLPASKGYEEPAQQFALTKQYCYVHAAAVCLHLWLHNRGKLSDFFDRGEWLVLCLHSLIQSIDPLLISTADNAADNAVDNAAADGQRYQNYRENMAQHLLSLYEESRLFSVVPIDLATAEQP